MEPLVWTAPAFLQRGAVLGIVKARFAQEP